MLSFESISLKVDRLDMQSEGRSVQVYRLTLLKSGVSHAVRVLTFCMSVENACYSDQSRSCYTRGVWAQQDIARGHHQKPA